MLQRRRLLFLSALVLSALAVRLLMAFERLPEHVGSHFNLAGEADSFQSKGTFVGLSIGLHVALFSLFAFLPKLLRHLPARFINVPRGDHWFAPERVEESVERLTPYLDWLGLATVTFTAAVSELTLRANLSGGGLDNTAAVLLVGGYALVMVVWSIRIRRAFV